jgi:hypothetical protein
VTLSVAVPLSEWEPLLRDALAHCAEPVFSTPTTNIPAASLWVGSRHWARALRKCGLESNDVVCIDMALSPAFVQVLVACLCNGYRTCFGDAVAGDNCRLVITDEMVNGLAGPVSELVAGAPMDDQQLEVETIPAVRADVSLTGSVVLAHGLGRSYAAVERLVLVPILSKSSQLIFATGVDVTELVSLHQPYLVAVA